MLRHTEKQLYYRKGEILQFNLIYGMLRRDAKNCTYSTKKQECENERGESLICLHNVITLDYYSIQICE